MTDDVVERLREAADNAEALNWDNTTAILREAASALTEARKEVERTNLVLRLEREERQYMKDAMRGEIAALRERLDAARGMVRALVEAAYQRDGYASAVDALDAAEALLAEWDAARGEGEGNTTPTETEVMPPEYDSRHGLPMPSVPIVPVDPPSPAPSPTVEELSGGLHGHRVWDASAPSPCNATLTMPNGIRYECWGGHLVHCDATDPARPVTWTDAYPGATPHTEEAR